MMGTVYCIRMLLARSPLRSSFECKLIARAVARDKSSKMIIRRSEGVKEGRNRKGGSHGMECPTANAAITTPARPREVASIYL